MVVMGDYINNVLRYSIKHYSYNRYSYYALILATFGVPLLFGYASHSVATAAMMAGAILLFDMLFTLHLSTRDMRSKSTFVMENTLPLSSAERYTFIMVNSMVMATLLFAICFIPAVAILMQIYPPLATEAFDIGDLFVDYRPIVELLAIHAVLLIVNITARARVVMNYIIALCLMTIGELLIEKFIPSEHINEAEMWINAIIAIVCWVLGYFLLRYREIKL